MGEQHKDVYNAIIPSVKEVGDGIVRMNALHDSNIQKELVLKTAAKYEHVFFNTSIDNFDFPGPVVWTANRIENMLPKLIEPPANLMFVRLKVTPFNLGLLAEGVKHYARLHLVPVVLTFMRYYDLEALSGVDRCFANGRSSCYEKRKHIINEYWCPIRKFKAQALYIMKKIGGRLVTMCGTLDSDMCKDCLNCEHYYRTTIKHMSEK